MENININEVYDNLKQIIGDNYFTFTVYIDKDGVVKFKCYVSVKCKSENFSKPSPELLYQDIKHWLSQFEEENQSIDNFNINLCNGK